MTGRHGEPNASLPLQWSGYRPRQVAGVALIIVGASLFVPTTAYTLPIGLLGAAVHVLGWVLLPAPGWRRLLGASAGLATLLLTLLGSQVAWALAVLLALWFLVRRRPARVYPLVLAPAVAGFLVGQLDGAFGHRFATVAVTGLVAVAAAWAGAVLQWRSSGSISRNSLDRP